MQSTGGRPASQGEAREWLLSQGIQATLAAALAAVLIRLWTKAWHAGTEAATALAGAASIPPLVLADLLSQYGGLWAREIVSHAMDRMAAILAAGGTAAALTAALSAMLNDAAAAQRIALTETIRAMMAGAFEHYRYAGIRRVAWVTEGPAPCPACIANEAAGPRSLGMPFPSGDIAPPGHPNCRCALVPVME